MDLMTDPSLALARDAMRAHARSFYQHGWLMGTSGNLSVRHSPTTFLITASGKDKGDLGPDDFLLCDLDATPVHATSLKPSAETLLHGVIYAHDPAAGAIYHTHDPFAALCSARDAAQGYTPLTDVEMIKGLDLWDEGATVHIPILPNPADLRQLAALVREHLQRRQPGRFHAPCVNILRHGVYAWGRSPHEAKRHMESLAYLLHYAWQWGLWAR